MYFNKINTIRTKKGYTLAKLAELSGISAGYLCHLEKGTRTNPSIDVMNKISTALNKSITDIFFE